MIGVDSFFFHVQVDQILGIVNEIEIKTLYWAFPFDTLTISGSHTNDLLMSYIRKF